MQAATGGAAAIMKIGMLRAASRPPCAQTSINRGSVKLSAAHVGNAGDHRHHQHDLEEDRGRVMEAGREEFHDVLGIPGIAQVLRHVHVQMIRVRIDQARCQAGEAAQEVRPRAEQRRPAIFGEARKQSAEDFARRRTP